MANVEGSLSFRPNRCVRIAYSCGHLGYDLGVGNLDRGEGLSRGGTGFFLTSVANSAASLANRSDLSRKVFSRIARASASYSVLAFSPSPALCTFLNAASVRRRSFEL